MHENDAIEVNGRKISSNATEVTVIGQNGSKSISRFGDYKIESVPMTKAYDRTRLAMAPGSKMLSLHGSPVLVAPVDVLEAVMSRTQSRTQMRRPGLYMTDAATAARRIVGEAYGRASRKKNYPGEYYPLLQEARAAHERWSNEFPGAASLEMAQNLEFKAASIADNYCDLDGSLNQTDIERHNTDREAERVQLRLAAATLRANAMGMPGIEVVE